jgi:hypothetical protein
MKVWLGEEQWEGARRVQGERQDGVQSCAVCVYRFSIFIDSGMRQCTLAANQHRPYYRFAYVPRGLYLH